MNLWPLILLLGACFPHWTTATPVPNVNYNLTDGVLMNVVPANAESVNLSHLHIESIAVNALDALKGVQTLDLSNNDLVDLPPLIFSKLVNLRELSLFNNSISSFDNTFVGLANLKRLDLSENPIKSLERGDLFGLTKTVKVSVDRTGLRKISSGIFEKPRVPVPIENKKIVRNEGQNYEFEYHISYYNIRIINGILESFELGTADNFNIEYSAYETKRDNVFRLFHKGISGFKNDWLKVNDSYFNEIDLSFNNMNELSPELLNTLPPAVTGISLNNNRITVLRKNDRLENTTIELDLSANGMTTIEDGAFGKLNLLELYLKQNLLSSTAFARTLPKTIKVLRLDENQISEIPRESFYGLENLRTLTIIRNQVKNIEPGTFRDQKNLKSLLLMENKISELKPGLFQGLDSLKMFDLGSNEIKKIPSNLLGGFSPNPKKFTLNLYANNIETIEDGAFSYMNLSSISLRSDQLNDDLIGEGTFNGSDISEIVLASNAFKMFNGEWFKGVSGLKSIDLGSTLVTKIEKGFAKYMKNVTSLALRVRELRLENGALFGLSTEEEVKISLGWGTRVKVIEGGLFNDD